MKIDIKRIKLPHCMDVPDTLGYMGEVRFCFVIDTHYPVDKDNERVGIKYVIVPEEDSIKHNIQVRIWSEFYSSILEDLLELRLRVLSIHPINFQFEKTFEELINKVKKIE